VIADLETFSLFNRCKQDLSNETFLAYYITPVGDTANYQRWKYIHKEKTFFLGESPLLSVAKIGQVSSLITSPKQTVWLAPDCRGRAAEGTHHPPSLLQHTGPQGHARACHKSHNLFTA